MSIQSRVASFAADGVQYFARFLIRVKLTLARLPQGEKQIFDERITLLLFFKLINVLQNYCPSSALRDKDWSFASFDLPHDFRCVSLQIANRLYVFSKSSS